MGNVTTFVAGDTLPLEIAVLNEDLEPVNLTGSILSFYTAFTNGDSWIFKDSYSGITTDDAVGGIVTVTIPSSETALILRPRAIVWELVMKDPFDLIHTVARGKFRIAIGYGRKHRYGQTFTAASVNLTVTGQATV